MNSEKLFLIFKIFLKRRKIILPLVLCLFFVAFLSFFLIAKVNKKKVVIKKKAVGELPLTTLGPTNLDVNYFKTSYKAMLPLLGNYVKRISNFGGMLVLTEFDSGSPDRVFPTPVPTWVGQYWAGHLGSFFAPPFYSTHLEHGKDTLDWREGFDTSIVLYSRNTNQASYEEFSGSDEAYWYPSKMEVSHIYNNSKINAKITGKKIAIPRYRAFGLKIKAERVNSDENLNILFLPRIPSIRKLDTWNPVDEAYKTWLWKIGPSGASEENYSGTAEYDPANKVIVFNNPSQQAYVLVGLNKTPVSWRISDDPVNVYSHFNSGGVLENVVDDSPQKYEVFGLTYNFPTLTSGTSDEVTMLVTIGSSRQEVLNIYNTLKNQNIEQISDSFWNQRLQNLYNNVPHLETKLSDGNYDQTMEKIYYNSLINMLLNKWEGPFEYIDPYLRAPNTISPYPLPPPKGTPTNRSFYGLASMQGESIAEYVWDQAYFGQMFAFADPAGLKDQIKRFLTLDYTRCRAYDSLFGWHNCQTEDGYYSASRWALIEMIYEYATLVDSNFLNENVKGPDQATHKVIDLVEQIVNFGDELAGGADELADYGTDHNLLEFTIHCNLGGYYTGKTAFPNAERYDMHKKAADLYRKLGDIGKASEHETKAGQIKNALNTLWNDSAGWFDTISLYETRKCLGNGKVCSDIYGDADCQKDTGGKCVYPPRTTPYRNTFWTVVNGRFLNFDGLLTENQKQKIQSKLTDPQYFAGPYGFYSLPYKDKSTWCSRIDFQGPGLYLGEEAFILTGLFKTGYKDFAYKMYRDFQDQKDFGYLKDMPYWSESLVAGTPRLSAVYGGLTGFVNGPVIAQALVKGMFGVEPLADISKISPRKPAKLSEMTLSNIKSQGNVFGITVNNFEHSLTAEVSKGRTPENNFYFIYTLDDGPKNVKFLIKNLLHNTLFKIIINSVEEGLRELYVPSNQSGEIVFNQTLRGENTVSGIETVAPTSTPTRTPTPTPSRTPTPTGTSTPIPTAIPTKIPCYGRCEFGQPGSCVSELVCSQCNTNGICYCVNPYCPEQLNCICLVPTNTPVATSTPTPTRTPTPSSTRTPTPTRTPVPTATRTPIPTSTSVPIPTSTVKPSNTPTPTRMSTPTLTRIPTPTATRTPTPTATRTPTPRPTDTTTPIPTPVPTPTPLPSDINQDYKVDHLDTLFILNSWLKIGTSTNGYREDINKDSKVNGIDFGLVMKDWGR